MSPLVTFKRGKSSKTSVMSVQFNVTLMRKPMCLLSRLTHRNQLLSRMACRAFPAIWNSDGTFENDSN